MNNKIKMLLNNIELVYEQARVHDVDFEDKDEYEIISEILHTLEVNKPQSPKLKVVK